MNSTVARSADIDDQKRIRIIRVMRGYLAFGSAYLAMLWVAAIEPRKLPSPSLIGRSGIVALVIWIAVDLVACFHPLAVPSAIFWGSVPFALLLLYTVLANGIPSIQTPKFFVEKVNAEGSSTLVASSFHLTSIYSAGCIVNSAMHYQACRGY